MAETNAREVQRPPALGWKAYTAIGYTALFLRLAYLVFCWRGELIHGLFLDSRFYAMSAADIRNGVGAGDSPYLLSPLYPYWLALFPGIESNPITNPAWWPRILQAALGAGTCCLAARLGTNLDGRRAGLIAGWIAVLYGPLIHHDVAILVAGPQAFFLTLGIVLTTEKSTFEHGARAGWRWAAAGLALGIGTALRPTVLVVLGALVGFLALVCLARRLPLRAVGARAALLLVGAGLVILPFSVRNVRVTGQFVLLSANGGMNFWIGNQRHSLGVYASPPGRTFEGDPLFLSYVEKKRGEPTTHLEASRWWWSESVKEVRADPAAWGRLLLRKALLFIHPLEIPQLGWNFQWYRDRIWLLRFPLNGFHVLLLAAAAPLLVGRRGLRRFAWPLVALVVYSLAIVAFFITARYRLPIVPLAIALGGVSLARLHASLVVDRSRSFGRALGVLVGILVLGASGQTFFAQHYVYPTETGIEEAQYASYLVESGRYAEAVERFPKVLESFDRHATRVTYAEALRELGRTTEALEQYRIVLEQDPEHSVVWFNYGNLLWEDFRKGAEAEAAYRRSIELVETNPDAHFNLGVVLLQQRRFEEARGWIERALELQEGDEAWLPEADKALAIIRERTGG